MFKVNELNALFNWAIDVRCLIKSDCDLSCFVSAKCPGIKAIIKVCGFQYNTVR